MKPMITFTLCLVVTIASAQGMRTFNPEEANFKRAKALYDEDKYEELISFLEPMIAGGNTSSQLTLYLANGYAFSGSYEKAVEVYEKLLAKDPDYNYVSYYYCGYSYSQLKQYDKAVGKYDLFLQKHPKTADYTLFNHRAKYKRDYALKHAALIKSEVRLKDPVLLTSLVNTQYPEYLPMLDPTGRKLYFTSDRKGGISQEQSDDSDFDEDLFFIEKINNQWTAPMLMPEPINSTNNDGAASFSADGQTMVYGACGREDGIGSCDLYISYLEGNTWSQPVNMGNVVNSSGWDAHSTISYDGNRIIFSSGRNGGYGNEDLYMVERNIFGDWGVPINLGSMVNTPFDESSPFLSQDGKTLYFASSGHPGFGGYDVFKTIFENGRWSEPVNVGRPLNTPGDDKYFTIGGSGEVGYFSSDRGGNLDLYEIEIPEDMRPQPTVIVSGTVTSAKTNSPVGAYVMVEDLNTGELIAVNKSNSATGKYLVVLPAGITYSVSANKEGYFFYSQKFDVPLTQRFEEITKDIALKPIEKGAKVVLNNIFFETGKSILSPQSKVELQRAIDLMRANPSMVIEVGGHTDNVGDDLLNMKLSHDRAKSVRDYLVNGGIESVRVQAKGYGELNPIATNETDEGKQANRRTEFVILEF